MKRLCAVLVVTLLGKAGAAPQAPRQAIEAAYSTEGEAASIMFVEGMLSIRTPDFRAYAPNGEELNPDEERGRLAGFIQNALSVHEEVKILAFQQPSPTHALCRIRDHIEVVKLGRQGPRRLILESLSSDEWVQTPRGWKQKSCRMQEQTLTTESVAPPKS